MWIIREEHSEIPDFLIKIQEDEIIILNIMDIMMIMQLLIEIHINGLYSNQFSDINHLHIYAN